MAEQEQEVLEQPDDKELFQAAMEPEPKAETPAQEQERVARERDEKGRFVAKEKEPEATAQPEKQPEQQAEAQPTEQKDEAQVPSWRLREVREAREAAERRAEETARQSYALQEQLRQMQAELAQLKAPKQEPVDFFADPDAALKQHLSPIEQRFERLVQDVKLSTSRTAAIAVNGADAVAEMENAIAQAMAKNHPDMPQLAMQMRASDDPAGVAMQWYKRSKIMETTGGDIDGYRNKVLEDALKDKDFLAKALELARGQAGATKGNPVVQLPPSLNRAPSGGNANNPDDDDISDRALFKDAMAYGRR